MIDHGLLHPWLTYLHPWLTYLHPWLTTPPVTDDGNWRCLTLACHWRVTGLRLAWGFMLGHLGEIFGKFDKFWLFLSADRFQNMRFLEGNSLTGSFSRKFRVQQAKKAKTKSIYTPSHRSKLRISAFSTNFDHIFSAKFWKICDLAWISSFCDAILMKICRKFTKFQENVEGLSERAHGLHKQNKVA